MSVIFLLLTISTLMAGLFLLAFIRSVRKGQFDDDRSPAVRILMDDTVPAGDSISRPSELHGPRHSPVHPIANEPS